MNETTTFQGGSPFANRGEGGFRPASRSRSSQTSRGALRRELADTVGRFGTDEDDDVGMPIRLKGGKKRSAMMRLKREKGEAVIPKGDYCYDENGNCPYWDLLASKPKQDNGFCWFDETGDWIDGGLRWDQCKSCGRNLSDDEGAITL